MCRYRWFCEFPLKLFIVHPKTGKDGTDSTEKDWDAPMTQIKEKEWFAAHPHYKSIQHLCGIERLMECMISLLANKMIAEIPGLVRDMKERKTVVRKERTRCFNNSGQFKLCVWVQKCN